MKKSKNRFRRPTVSKLTKELDRLVSLRVRQSRADKEGLVTCYTCPYRGHWKKMHAGHYLTRYFKATRWDERNLRPQCFMCNIYRKGNSVIFRNNLLKEIGEKQVLDLEKNANYVVRGGSSIEELQAKIVLYTPTPRQLEK